MVSKCELSETLDASPSMINSALAGDQDYVYPWLSLVAVFCILTPDAEYQTMDQVKLATARPAQSVGG